MLIRELLILTKLLDIHRYLMKGLLWNDEIIVKRMFIVLFTSIVNASSHAKSNQKCDI